MTTRTYAQLATPAGLATIAAYADGIGPSKDYIVPRDATGASLPPTSFVGDAHAAGLLVHPYTFRNENSFLPLELRRGSDPAAWGNAIAEYEQFFGLGVDGAVQRLSGHGDRGTRRGDRLMPNGRPRKLATTCLVAAIAAVAGMPANLARVVVQGSTSVPHEWLRLTVDPAMPGVFSCESIGFGTGATTSCPAPLAP